MGQGLTPSACPSSTCVLPCASLRTIVGGAAAQDRSGESVGTWALAGGGGRDGRAGREPCITWHGAVLILQTTSSVSCVAGSCAKCGAQLSRADSTTQQRRAGRAGRRVQQRRPRLCAANGRRTRKKTKTRERAAHRREWRAPLSGWLTQGVGWRSQLQARNAGVTAELGVCSLVTGCGGAARVPALGDEPAGVVLRAPLVAFELVDHLPLAVAHRAGQWNSLNRSCGRAGRELDVGGAERERGRRTYLWLSTSATASIEPSSAWNV